MLSVSLKNRTVLVLDDDPTVAPILGEALGVKALSYSRVQDLLDHPPEAQPIAAFVDLHLEPGRLGLEVFPSLRDHFPFVPIIVITSNGTDEALKESLDAGADDFVRKPFNFSEISARLQRRLSELSKQELSDTLKLSDVTLNLAHRTLKGSGKRVPMTPTGTRILQLLIEAKGLVVSRERVKKVGWEREAVSENSVDKTIYEIRKALEVTSKCVQLKAVYGKGFVLTTETKPPRDM